MTAKVTCMATFLIPVLAALSVVLIIAVLGLILTQMLIKRADKAQLHADIASEQVQGVVVDIDQLPEVDQEPGITVISNDVIEGTSQRPQHLKKKTVSVIDQDAQLNHSIMKHNHTGDDLTDPITTDSDTIPSVTSIVNPLTDKITLEY